MATLLLNCLFPSRDPSPRAPAARYPSRRAWPLLVAAACGLVAGTLSAQNAYLQHNLVSDLAGQADRVDTNLVNPWGIATSATSPFWVSDNHSGFSTLYNSTGAVLTLVVTVPPPANGQSPAAPTGIVFNGDSKSFLLGTNASHFIFSTEDGTISGWSGGTNAVLKVDNSASNSIYKGLALARNGGSNFLYATDFHNSKVDVFDASFHPVTLPGGFTDTNLPAGFAPFGIQNIGTNLFVTYALQDDAKEDDVGGPGNGFVDVYDLNGNLLKRFASQGSLNSPWGLAMAPEGFGQFSNSLLIGNFGDGTINSFDPASGASLGTLNDTNGAPIKIQGLWGLKFGNGGQGGKPLQLYFTAGIPGPGHVEDHGLFGVLSVASSIPLTLSTVSTNSVTLSWSGGTAPYLVQRKTSFSDTNWFDVLTTTNQTAMVAKDSATAFYRVMDHAPTSVMPFTVLMSAAAEVPTVTNSLGTGFGIMSLKGSTLAYHIEFSGLTGPATASHIHGPASATNAAGVLTPLTFPKAASGVLEGTIDVSSYTPDQLAVLKSGQTYVNIHTTENGGGEVRGQVAPVNYVASMNGASEIPAVNTTGTGLAQFTLIGNELTWNVACTGLSSSAVASHIHGPAPTTANAGVLFPLGNPTGTSPSISGSHTLTMEEFDDLIDGLTYANVHTSNNQTGEIRGQVVPQ